MGRGSHELGGFGVRVQDPWTPPETANLKALCLSLHPLESFTNPALWSEAWE